MITNKGKIIVIYLLCKIIIKGHNNLTSIWFLQNN